MESRLHAGHSGQQRTPCCEGCGLLMRWYCVLCGQGKKDGEDGEGVARAQRRRMNPLQMTRPPKSGEVRGSPRSKVHCGSGMSSASQKVLVDHKHASCRHRP